MKKMNFNSGSKNPDRIGKKLFIINALVSNQNILKVGLSPVFKQTDKTIRIQEKANKRCVERKIEIFINLSTPAVVGHDCKIFPLNFFSTISENFLSGSFRLMLFPSEPKSSNHDLNKGFFLCGKLFVQKGFEPVPTTLSNVVL